VQLKEKWGVETRRGIHGMLTLLQGYVSDEWLGKLELLMQEQISKVRGYAPMNIHWLILLR
jgi:hypothetical protein